jgi:hypothetical protein
MTNVIPFQRKTTMQAASPADDVPDAIEARPAFSFDMLQTEEKGFVLIDACVPMALAVEFMDLLTRYREDADTEKPVNSNKRRSRTRATA